MHIYEVYISSVAQSKIANGEAPQFDRLDQLKCVRDAKSILALAFPAFWLVFHRLWWELAIYMCVAVGFALFATTNIGQNLAILSIIPGIYLLLEGNNLIAAKLLRNGWRQVAVTEATNLEDAELRFLTDMLDGPQLAKTGFAIEKSASKPNVLIPQNDTPDFGLFSES